MSKEPKPETGIAKAVAQFKSQEALADQLGVKRQAVQQWVAKGYVPLDRIPDVSALTGVPREELVDPRYKAVLS